MDLQLLTGLLQNPVLCNILKLEDALVELNQHLTHHPSLLPTDFDIDRSGQLILSGDLGPPEPTKGKLTPEYSNGSSSKASATTSPELPSKKDGMTKMPIHQSFQLAAAKREIISIQVMVVPSFSSLWHSIAHFPLGRILMKGRMCGSITLILQSIPSPIPLRPLVDFT